MELNFDMFQQQSYTNTWNYPDKTNKIKSNMGVTVCWQSEFACHIPIKKTLDERIARAPKYKIKILFENGEKSDRCRLHNDYSQVIRWLPSTEHNFLSKLTCLDYLFAHKHMFSVIWKLHQIIYFLKMYEIWYIRQHCLQQS